MAPKEGWHEEIRGYCLYIQNNKLAEIITFRATDKTEIFYWKALDFCGVAWASSKWESKGASLNLDKAKQAAEKDAQRILGDISKRLKKCSVFAGEETEGEEKKSLKLVDVPKKGTYKAKVLPLFPPDEAS